MGEFISGVKEKFPKELLKGRIEVEGNVISSLMKDMLLLDETNLKSDDFITYDGFFYFNLLDKLRKKGFSSLDEITILSTLPEEVINRYEDLGGWDVIQHQIDIINLDNFQTYIDILYRENILINMCKDGFNILKEINVNGKNIKPLSLFRKMTAEEVIDWYEARMSTYGTGYSSKILEEEDIDFDDEFFDNCEEGLENGVPFDIAGLDVNLDEINCFPFLSRQINGMLHGTFNMIGGFSSVGKSTWMITVLMGLIHNGEKVLIITNEEDIKRFKIKFTTWILAKYQRYYGVTKKKLMSGNISKEDREHINDFKQYWKEEYKNKIKIISIADADMSVVKKKIRENVLRNGFTTVFYDTFKIQIDNMDGNRTDLSLVKDSRDLHKMAKKYNIIMLASVQLSEATRNQLFLSAANTSNSKQLKEILENYFLIRNVFDEELDPKSKYFCRPYQLKKVNDKWIEKEYECDRTAVWRMLFVEKARNGFNSPDTGTAYLLKFSGDHSVFREVAMCRPKHGTIG